MKVSDETLWAMATALRDSVKNCKFLSDEEYRFTQARAAADAIPEGDEAVAMNLSATRIEITRLNGEVENLRADLATSRRFVAAGQKDIENLCASIDERDRLKKQTQEIVDGAQKEIACLREEIAGLRKELVIAHKEIFDLKGRATPAPPSEEAVKAKVEELYRDWMTSPISILEDWLKPIARQLLSAPTPQPAPIDDATVERLAEAAHKAWHGPKSSAVSWGETHRSLRVDWLNVSRAILAALPATAPAPSELHAAIDLAAELSREGIESALIGIKPHKFHFIVYAKGCAPVERQGPSLLTIVRSAAEEYRASLAPPPPPDPVMRVLEEAITTDGSTLYFFGDYFHLKNPIKNFALLPRLHAELAQKIRDAIHAPPQIINAAIGGAP